MPNYTTYLNSPMGWLKIEATDAAITTMWFVNEVGKSNPNAILNEAVKQLTAYFAGELKTFNLPLAPVGTEFQNRVWAGLQNIPFGHSTSYGHLAESLGDIKAIRAVGTANGKNPIAIIIPCHRVIGSTGELTGYAGGIERKRWLLEHEGIIAKELF